MTWSNKGGRTENRHGHKTEQANGPGWTEDRAADYKRFRTQRVSMAGGYDVDQVEWRIGPDGEPFPVAILEVTRLDGDGEIPVTYLNSIIARMISRDLQGKLAKMIADRLGVKAWVVLYRYDLSEFWVYNLTDCRGWWHLPAAKYKAWLETLGFKRSL